MTYNKLVSHVGGWLFIIHYTRPANLTAVCGHFLMIIVLDAVPKLACGQGDGETIISLQVMTLLLKHTSRWCGFAPVMRV